VDFIYVLSESGRVQWAHRLHSRGPCTSARRTGTLLWICTVHDCDYYHCRCRVAQSSPHRRVASEYEEKQRLCFNTLYYVTKGILRVLFSGHEWRFRRNVATVFGVGYAGLCSTHIFRPVSLLCLFFNPEDSGDMLLRNVDLVSTDYTMLQPISWYSHSSRVPSLMGRTRAHTHTHSPAIGCQ
jgi:hypothetical protein